MQNIRLPPGQHELHHTTSGIDVSAFNYLDHQVGMIYRRPVEYDLSGVWSGGSAHRCEWHHAARAILVSLQLYSTLIATGRREGSTTRSRSTTSSTTSSSKHRSAIYREKEKGTGRQQYHEAIDAHIFSTHDVISDDIPPYTRQCHINKISNLGRCC